MSTFINPVVRIDNLRPNENSDKLDIWDGPQGPCQVVRGSFSVGDLATFIPADTMVDTSRGEFAHLAKHADKSGWYRLRGMKLRGHLSVGLVLPAPPGMDVGSDASAFYGTEKYEPPVWLRASYARAYSQFDLPMSIRNAPVYDVENMWRFNRVAAEDTTVRTWQITEKIHGANFRIYRHEDETIWVGSRSQWLRPEISGKPGEFWHEAAKLIFRSQLEPGYVYYGEVFGAVQDLKYGMGNEVSVRFFDRWSTHASGDVWASPNQRDAAWALAWESLPRVPVLETFTGTLAQAMERAKALASGETQVGLNRKQIREGVVVAAVPEAYVEIRDVAPSGEVRVHDARLLFKCISPAYLSRKDASETQE